MEEKTITRPTKKQQQLLEFIENFINEHGYGPSYREIMSGCSYTSVATVAVHVNNLITRGHLRKNGRSARSLEIVNPSLSSTPKLQTNAITPAEEKWLIEKVSYLFKQAEEGQVITGSQLSDLQTLVNSLKILGLEGASFSFIDRLNQLKQRIIE